MSTQEEVLSVTADAHLTEPFDGLARLEIVQLEELPDLDLAVRGARVRETFRPFKGLIPRFDLNQRVAGDELLGLCERAIQDCAFTVGVFDAPTLRARVKSIGV